MQVSSVHFARDAATALGREPLQRAMGKFKTNAIRARAARVAEMPGYEGLREQAKRIRDHAIGNLDRMLTEFEVNAARNGSKIHWAATPEEACGIVLAIAREHGCTSAVKSKSMATEEILLNRSLESGGISVVETDLGEYIIQLDRDRPSHIIAPAMHKTREEISTLFAEKHGTPYKSGPEALTREARQRLRPHFLSADMGISGANFLVADTGSTVLVTNEGNGRMVTSLPRVTIAMAGIDKIIPSIRDLPVMLKVLTASATGQRVSTYVSVNSGNRRDGDASGPESHHIVLIDAGRSALLGTGYQPMLRCIRCGACMNHCPVYQKIGGHPYGSPYPGPMGSVLTPLLGGMEKNAALPHAATFCGACQVVCPVKIPLPDLMRQLRTDQVRERMPAGRFERFMLSLWGWIAMHPHLYSLSTWLAAKSLAMLRSPSGFVTGLPGMKGWFGTRSLRVEGDGKTFMHSWRRK